MWTIFVPLLCLFLCLSFGSSRTFESTKVFIAIISRPAGHKMREGIRRTWMKNCVGNVTCKFVIGADKKNKELSKEIEEKADILFLDSHVDVYRNLSLKTLKTFDLAIQSFEFEVFVKCDDDVFLQVDLLSLSYLSSCPSDGSRCWYGFMLKDINVIKDHRHKNYDSLFSFFPFLFFLFYFLLYVHFSFFQFALPLSSLPFWFFLFITSLFLFPLFLFPFYYLSFYYFLLIAFPFVIFLFISFLHLFSFFSFTLFFLFLSFFFSFLLFFFLPLFFTLFSSPLSYPF